ncbi:histidinol-phosphate transaminase [uncultured Clostridium sp.]|uniref:histidinol-phosphate transaminase n=1 Tax=uncultured Clostridium sp. TaxID=59620 RepID=UPI0025D3AC3A|nr:histidinol-phosphate transaminase [uncultured Clostridium sp.]
MSRYWNDHVKTLKPYVPGEQPKDKKYIKLNTNENPYGPSKKVLEAVKKAACDDLKLYPDPTCSDLSAEIAEYYELNKDEVFLGNGSDEILAFVFMTFFQKGRKVLFPDISYTFYNVYAEMFNLDYELIKLDENFDIPLAQFNQKNGGIIFPNPNAPTGKYIDTKSIIEVIENNTDTVVVVDEAYIDFGGKSMVEYINKYPNLLVIQTFSKSRSLAGLRVGFAMGNAQLIEGLNRVKNSFNSYTIDRLALAGAMESIRDDDYFNETRNKIMKTREETVRKLEELDFKVLKSQANFIFIKHNHAKGQYLYEELKNNGILVRHFNRDRIEDYLRVTIGTDQEMDVLIEKLKYILKINS